MDNVSNVSSANKHPMEKKKSKEPFKGWRYVSGAPMRQWHFIVPALIVACLALGAASEGNTGLAAVLAVVTLILFTKGSKHPFFVWLGGQFTSYKTTYERELADIRRRSAARSDAGRLRPPVWPPRRPDDWGREIQEGHQAYTRMVRSMSDAKNRHPDPIMPIIPSWDEWHAKEQARHPLQIRWARTEQGEWLKQEWGNPAHVPPSGLLPVLQIMQEVASGHWHWVMIGEGAVSPGWQEGPARFETFSQQGNGGRVVQYRRPVGTAGVAPAPLPIEPGGEHGDSREQSVDDLVRAGIIAPR